MCHRFAFVLQMNSHDSRANMLILFSLDIWSAGCTMVEMFLQRPLFAGKDAHDQLARIMRVLGSPTTAVLRDLSIELKRPDLVTQECGFLPSKSFKDVRSLI